MHTVMGSHDHPVEVPRDFHTGEASREGLFVDVGMVKDSCFQDAAVDINDLPTVGIVVPAGVPVRYRHLEGVAAPTVCLCINFDDVGFPGEDGDALANQACSEQDKLSDHPFCRFLAQGAWHLDAKRVRLRGKFARLA